MMYKNFNLPQKEVIVPIGDWINQTILEVLRDGETIGCVLAYYEDGKLICKNLKNPIVALKVKKTDTLRLMGNH